MSSSSLEVPRRQRPQKRSRLRRVLAVLAILVLAVGWLIWFLRTPDDLPTSSRTVDGTGVVDQPLYVGVLAVGNGFDRTVTIDEIAVDVESDGEVDVEPRLCRGGSLNSVTTDPSSWCPQLEDPDGKEFGAGDSIVLVVTAAEPTAVEIGRLEVSFRDGIRWGTSEAGIAGTVLTFADHEPAPVDEPDPDQTTTDRPEPDPADQKANDKRKKQGKKKGTKGERQRDGGAASTDAPQA